MGEPSRASRRFACSPGGAVAAGRRRLRTFLLGLAVAVLAAAAWALAGGRVLAAILAVGVAALVRLAWRMSGDLEPLAIVVSADGIELRTRRAEVRLPRDGARARRLTAAEREHLEGLASLAGIVAGSGGFDSRLLGEFDLYAADLANAVLLESGESRLVVTPDDPDGFVALLGARPAPSPPGTICAP